MKLMTRQDWLVALTLIGAMIVVAIITVALFPYPTYIIELKGFQ